jgi:hypothetical protein
VKRSGLGSTVVALAVVAAVGSIAVAVHEFDYASGHPYAYGPAKVIAWGALAGAVLGVAVALVGFALARDSEQDREPAHSQSDGEREREQLLARLREARAELQEAREAERRATRRLGTVRTLVNASENRAEGDRAETLETARKLLTGWDREDHGLPP